MIGAQKWSGQVVQGRYERSISGIATNGTRFATNGTPGIATNGAMFAIRNKTPSNQSMCIHYCDLYHNLSVNVECIRVYIQISSIYINYIMHHVFQTVHIRSHLPVVVAPISRGAQHRAKHVTEHVSRSYRPVAS